MHYRPGESSNKVRYRTDRYLLIQEKWFFSTREGHNIGPFTNKACTHEGVSLFLRYIIHDPEHGSLYAERIAERGLWESTLYH